MKSSQKNRLSIGFLYDDTLDNTDGVAQYVKTIGGWLSDQGHRVVYLVGETKMTEWRSGKIYSLARNQAVVFNGNRMSVPWPANRRQIKQVLSENKLDVIHVQMPYSPFMAKRVIGLVDDSTAIAGTFHIYPANGLAKAGSGVLRLMLGRSLNKFDAIASVSRPAAGFAKRSFGINSVIIPNAVDVSTFAKAAKTKKRSEMKRIVFLGRLVERKGCRYLLEVFIKLKKIHPDVELVIAGDGPQRRLLEKLAKDKGVTSAVRFTGYISEKDKPKLLTSADIACFPSLYGESFGIVLIEAMAAGSGVVLAGNNPGYSNLLGAEPKSLIDPRNSDEFMARLVELLRDDKLTNRLGNLQRKEVKKYDVEKVGPRVVDLYRQAIASHSKRGHN